MKRVSPEGAYYFINGLFTLSASFIWGVNTLFLLKAGLDLAQSFIANAVFTAAMSAAEIPTGVFADTRGRRFSFLMSAFLLCVGTAGYVAAYFFGGGFLVFCLMSIVLGVGFAFYSGAMEAWIVDELAAEGYGGTLDAVFAKAGSIAGVAMIGGTLAGGFLGQIDLSLPYLFRIAALFALFVFASVFMRERGFAGASGAGASYLARVGDLAAKSFAYGWKVPTVRLFMLSGVMQSAFGIWGFYAAQPYLLGMLGDPGAVWISGLFTAGMALARVAGTAAVGPVLGRATNRSSVLVAASLGSALACLLAGLSRAFVPALICFLALMFVQGLFAPIRQSFMNACIPSEQRATVLSFDSLLGNGGAIVGQTALGEISHVASLGVAYLVGAGTLAAGAPFLATLRRLRSPADAVRPPRPA